MLCAYGYQRFAGLCYHHLQGRENQEGGLTLSETLRPLLGAGVTH